MGSWFGTCFLSGLPLVNEELVCLYIAQNPYIEEYLGKEAVNISDHWYVRSVPIYGKYYDYGQLYHVSVKMF